MALLSSVISTSSHALAIGPGGSTNPTINVDCSVVAAATGLNVKGNAAGAGVNVAALSSSANENLAIDAKGSGTVTIASTSTGNVAIARPAAVSGTIIGTSSSATALAVGANGATNPVIKVDASTASVATGLQVKGAAAAGGVAVTALSSGTDESLTIDAKGAGTVTINGTATGGITLSRAVTASSSVLSTSPTGGIGYATGAGGTVTQATSKSTGVTLNKTTGTVTMHNAALAASTTVGFTLSNANIVATDLIIVNIKSGATANSYSVTVGAVGTGSCQIELRNTSGGSLSEAVVLSFAVIKGIAA